MKRTILTYLALCITAVFATGAPAGVAFPGKDPGKAKSLRAASSFTLENDVIAASWQADGQTIHPFAIVNKLTGQRFAQKDASLFRLATTDSPAQAEGVVVEVRLDGDQVVALASRDGLAWSTLATFPRAELPGEPKLVRIGKMNLKAEAKDYYDHGPEGVGAISELSPLPASLPFGRFEFKTGANQAATKEYPFHAGTKIVSCRIDKGTDQGQSWGPALALIWEDSAKFLLVGVREKGPVFNITTAAGETTKNAVLASYPAFDVTSTEFHLANPPKLVRLEAQRQGVRVADGIAGVAMEAELVSARGIRALWRAELRDGSNYIRQTLDLSAASKTVALSGLELCDIRVPEAVTVGSCPGCPVAGSGMFFGVEMPGSQNAVGPAGARIGFASKLVLSATQSYAFGSVTGVAPEGQLRRAFLCYMERERARPSKPFLHYNCWYDLGFSVSEKSMLDVVSQFDAELVKKRGVPVLSYLVDDGWDNPDKGLWVENTSKFPTGFRGLSQNMAKADAHLSVWISPLGGYGGAKERTEWARKMDLIPATSELDLAEPGYKKWFQDRCLQMMREDGVNAFKWDRAGEGVSPHFMALLDVARNLRKQDRDVFINVTVGTWPSPFWLNHVDTTWRNGSADVGWAGKGDDREKWLTFRDGNCHHYFAEMSPLYPLNSAMHHGIVHGRCFQGERVGKAGPDLKNEARSYFANGASLQELYLTPSMMTADAWDRVAEAAKWAHANADVLRDSHWVGGDPLKMQTYGYAAWSPRKGTVMIRNPDDKPQTIALDAAVVFELPAGAPKVYALTSPYADQRLQNLSLKAGQPQTVTLEPFEVLVFDAVGK